MVCIDKCYSSIYWHLRLVNTIDNHDTTTLLTRGLLRDCLSRSLLLRGCLCCARGAHDINIPTSVTKNWILKKMARIDKCYSSIYWHLRLVNTIDNHDTTTLLTIIRLLCYFLPLLFGRFSPFIVCRGLLLRDCLWRSLLLRGCLCCARGAYKINIPTSVTKN